MENKTPGSNPSLDGITGSPRDNWDMVNKYGTYEVQDITENLFPAIGPDTNMKIPCPSTAKVKEKTKPKT